MTVTGWELPVSQNTSVSYLQLLHSLCWANGTAGEAGGETKSHPAKLILGPDHTLSQREKVDLGLQLLEGISRHLAFLFGNLTPFLCSLKDNLIKSSFSDQHILVLVSPMLRFPFLSVSFCQKQSPPHFHSLGCLPNYRLTLSSWSYIQSPLSFSICLLVMCESPLPNPTLFSYLQVWEKGRSGLILSRPTTKSLLSLTSWSS